MSNEKTVGETVIGIAASGGQCVRNGEYVIIGGGSEEE